MCKMFAVDLSLDLMLNHDNRAIMYKRQTELMNHSTSVTVIHVYKVLHIIMYAIDNSIVIH